MNTKAFFALLFLSVPILGFGQQQKNEVLFTVDGNPVYVATFERMYLKNKEVIDDKLQTDLDAYLNLYIDYSLKVTEAKAENLDENLAFKQEFQKYRSQLVDKYLTESEVTETLMQEAYERMQTAINASHILLRLQPNAGADTMSVYQRCMEIRKEILAGKSFSDAAKEYSEDPSAKKNSGDLGWFTVFKMVYPFETAAYETETGEISMPVRTQFGYHLIKVNDRRPAKGEVKVAHILLLDKGKDSIQEVKDRIFELYAKLQKGTSFEVLTEQFSEDKNSAARGGELNFFAPGALNTEKFEEVAFSLEKPNSISEPFHTKFGWHIVKLIEKRPIGSFEENKEALENKIKKDSRARWINESLLKDLRQEYGVKKNRAALDFFYGFVTDKIFTGEWKMDTTEIPLKKLVTIENTAKTYIDFAKYISQKQKSRAAGKDKKDLIDRWYEEFTNKFVLEYHKAHLGTTNPEFAAIAEEYYNGLLLFDLMQEKIWDRAKKDTLGLNTFFEAHKKEYGSKNLEDVQGLVESDYQKYLEAAWMKGLHGKYKVDVNRKNFKKMKKHVEKNK